MKNTTIKMDAPIFTGFYESIWLNSDNSDLAYQMENDEGDRPTDWDFDYKAYTNDVSIAYCKQIEGTLQTLFKGVESYSFANLDSPREYNFRTDKIEGILTISDYNIFWASVLEYVTKHKNEITETIKEQWTSKDGFVAFLSNDINKWIQDIEKEGDLSTLIGYIMELGDITEMEFYEEISCNGITESEYCTNLKFETKE